MPITHLNRRRIVRAATWVALVAIIGLGGLLMWRWGNVYDCRLCDFRTYVAASERLFAGQPLYAPWQSEPYLLIDAARGEGFIYPPSAGPFLAWVLITPELVWRLLNAGALLVVLAMVMHRNGVSDAPLKAGALLLVFSPMWIAWSNGQVTPLLAAGMGLAWLFPRAAWGIAAVGAAIKVFPAVLLAWIYRERGLRPALISVAVMITLVAATVPITGLHAWPEFADALSNGRPNCNYDPFNSIRCTLHPLIGPMAAQALALGFSGALAIWSLRVRSSRIAFMMLCVAVATAAPDLNRPYLLIPLLGLVVAWPELPVRAFLHRSTRPLVRLRGRLLPEPVRYD